MLEVTRENCRRTYEWCDEDIDSAEEQINSIFDGIKNGMYHEGNRNNMAVDLSICFYVLGVSDVDWIIDFLKQNCGFVDIAKQSDLKDRIDMINGYLDYWAEHNILTYMVDVWPKPKNTYIKVVD